MGFLFWVLMTVVCTARMAMRDDPPRYGMVAAYLVVSFALWPLIVLAMGVTELVKRGGSRG